LRGKQNFHRNASIGLAVKVMTTDMKAPEVVQSLNDNGDEILQDVQSLNDNGDEKLQDAQSLNDNGDEISRDLQSLNDNGDEISRDCSEFKRQRR